MGAALTAPREDLDSGQVSNRPRFVPARQLLRCIRAQQQHQLRVLALGAEGIVSVASNEVPDLMSRMTDLALAGDWNEARELHYRLLPLMEVNFIESSPGPLKAAMAMMGLLQENFRLPLVPIQEKSRTRIREVIIELGLVKEAAHAAA